MYIPLQYSYLPVFSYHPLVQTTIRIVQLSTVLYMYTRTQCWYAKFSETLSRNPSSCTVHPYHSNQYECLGTTTVPRIISIVPSIGTFHIVAKTTSFRLAVVLYNPYSVSLSIPFDSSHNIGSTRTSPESISKRHIYTLCALTGYTHICSISYPLYVIQISRMYP